MSKDPAFLFYPGDWNLGTMHMTLTEKGAYIELLMLQFARDKFTLAHAKHMLNGSFDLVWATIQEKFVTDGKYYWNERLKEEKEKRIKFTESRRNNSLSSKKYDKDMIEHMQPHMEDENKDENKDNKRRRKPFKKPTIEEVKQFFIDNGYKAEIGEDKWHYYNDADWFDSKGNPVLNWKQKMRSVWFKPEYKSMSVSFINPPAR